MNDIWEESYDVLLTSDDLYNDSDFHDVTSLKINMKYNGKCYIR